MFDFKIDGSPEALTLGDETIFGEVMEKLSDRMKAEGKVITNIMVNEQSLSGGGQVDFYHFPLTKVETLELRTADPYKLANDALDSTYEHLLILQRVALETAEMFRMGDDIRANENYSQLVDGLRWLVKAVAALTGMLNIDIEEEFSGGKSIKHYQDEMLVPIFDQMYEVQKEEDWVGLADVLEYELVEALQKWEQMLPVFRRTYLEN
ncbi:hypothetical protein ISS30_00435 [bacterium]|nr:hypothetical protein [FCB group bacterium]MBL7190137.1 hypothetical protein [bacterium]